MSEETTICDSDYDDKGVMKDEPWLEMLTESHREHLEWIAKECPEYAAQSLPDLIDLSEDEYMLQERLDLLCALETMCQAYDSGDSSKIKRIRSMVDRLLAHLMGRRVWWSGGGACETGKCAMGKGCDHFKLLLKHMPLSEAIKFRHDGCMCTLYQEGFRTDYVRTIMRGEPATFEPTKP
jgi:hypothetical protein